MKHVAALVVVLTLVFSWILASNSVPSMEETTVSVGGTTFQTEVARTSNEQSKGLSMRPALGNNEAMLFPYEEPVIPAFWMKDMNFPLDIIWIDENKMVVDIDSNISPDTYPETFSPDEEIRYVLEVNAGRAAAAGIDIGTTLDF